MDISYSYQNNLIDCIYKERKLKDLRRIRLFAASFFDFQSSGMSPLLVAASLGVLYPNY
jgi:hypothetical protein